MRISRSFILSQRLNALVGIFIISIGLSSCNLPFFSSKSENDRKNPPEIPTEPTQTPTKGGGGGGGQTQTPTGGEPTQTPTGGGQTQTPTGGGQTQTPTGGGQTQTPTGGEPTQTPPTPLAGINFLSRNLLSLDDVLCSLENSVLQCISEEKSILHETDVIDFDARHAADHSTDLCLVKKEGTVHCYELDTGDNTQKPKFHHLPGPLNNVRTVRLSSNYACVITNNNHLSCYQDQKKNIQDTTDIFQIVTTKDTIYTLNKFGSVHQAKINSKESETFQKMAQGDKILKISRDDKTICAMSSASDAKCWPISGNADHTNSLEGVSHLSGENCFLKDNELHYNGFAYSLPTATNAKNISCNTQNGCVQKDDGLFVCYPHFPKALKNVNERTCSDRRLIWYFDSSDTNINKCITRKEKCKKTKNAIWNEGKCFSQQEFCTSHGGRYDSSLSHCKSKKDVCLEDTNNVWHDEQCMNKEKCFKQQDSSWEIDFESGNYKCKSAEEKNCNTMWREQRCLTENDARDTCEEEKGTWHHGIGCESQKKRCDAKGKEFEIYKGGCKDAKGRCLADENSWDKIDNKCLTPAEKKEHDDCDKIFTGSRRIGKRCETPKEVCDRDSNKIWEEAKNSCRLLTIADKCPDSTYIYDGIGCRKDFTTNMQYASDKMTGEPILDNNKEKQYIKSKSEQNRIECRNFLLAHTSYLKEHVKNLDAILASAIGKSQLEAILKQNLATVNSALKAASTKTHPDKNPECWYCKGLHTFIANCRDEFKKP